MINLKFCLTINLQIQKKQKKKNTAFSQFGIHKSKKYFVQNSSLKKFYFQQW